MKNIFFATLLVMFVVLGARAQEIQQEGRPQAVLPVPHRLIELTPWLSPQQNAHVISLTSDGRGVGRFETYQGFNIIPSAFRIENYQLVSIYVGIDYATCVSELNWYGGALGGSQSGFAALSNGPMIIQLPNPFGTTRSVVTCVSDNLTDRSGYAAGNALVNNVWRALRWKYTLSGWTYEFLDPQIRASEVRGINNKGETAGSVANVSTGQARAAFWNANRVMTDIGTLGGRYSYCTAINNNSLVVGISEKTTNLVKPFAYSSSRGRRDLAPGYSMGAAYDVNDAGEVGGWVLTGTPTPRQKPAIIIEGFKTTILDIGRGIEGEVLTISSSGNAGGNIRILNVNRTAALWLQ